MVNPTMSLAAVDGLLLVIDLSSDPFGPDLSSVMKTVAYTLASLPFPDSVVGRTAALQVGGVLSILIGPKNAGGFAWLPATSVQLPMTPLVVPSALTVTGGSRLATPDWFPPLSVQWNVTTTSWFVQVPAA